MLQRAQREKGGIAMFPGISAAAPILSILGIAVGLQVIKLGLKIFGKSEWIYYAETLALISVSSMVLVASLSFLKQIADVFK